MFYSKDVACHSLLYALYDRAIVRALSPLHLINCLPAFELQVQMPPPTEAFHVPQGVLIRQASVASYHPQPWYLEPWLVAVYTLFPIVCGDLPR